MPPNKFLPNVFRGWCRGGSSDQSDSGTKTATCTSWTENGYCAYGNQCPYFHPARKQSFGSRWGLASKPGKTVTWRKPSKGWTKINTDGSFQQGKASCGGVLRDSEGSIVKAFGRYIGETKKYSSITALEAESIGIMDGIDLASDMGLQKVWLESDSSIAVNMVKNFRIDTAPFLCCAWKKTLAKIKGISDFKVSHIYREGNAVADSLAANAFYEKVPRVLTMEADQVPAYITKKAEADASGKVYWRFK